MSNRTPLYEAVNAAVTLYLQLKSEPDRNAAERLRAVAGELARAFTIVQQHAGDLGSASSRDRAIGNIETRIAFDESVALNQFFDQVARSLIHSQRQLDLESVAYNRALDTLPVKLPKSWYSIPNLKAELKLGFSQVSSRGVNVVLFQNASQKQSYGESTITFEIAAGPAPPASDTLGGCGGALELAPPPAQAEAGETAPELRPEAPPAAEEPEAEPEPEVAPGDAPSHRRSRLPANLPPLLTFPLTGERKERMVAALASRLGEPGARVLGSPASRVCVLPSNPDPLAAQPCLFLCFGPGIPAHAGRRVTAWYAESSPGQLELRSGIYRFPAALEDQALVVPPPTELRRWSRQGPANLRYLLGNLGDLLMTIALHAASFQPAARLSGKPLHDLLRSRSQWLPPVFDYRTLAFHHPAYKPTHHVLLRPVPGASPKEWREIHAALVTRMRVCPVLIGFEAALPPAAMQRIIGESARLLTALIRIFEHA